MCWWKERKQNEIPFVIVLGDFELVAHFLIFDFLQIVPLTWLLSLLLPSIDHFEIFSKVFFSDSVQMNTKVKEWKLNKKEPFPFIYYIRFWNMILNNIRIVDIRSTLDWKGTLIFRMANIYQLAFESMSKPTDWQIPSKWTLTKLFFPFRIKSLIWHILQIITSVLRYFGAVSKLLPCIHSFV